MKKRALEAVRNWKGSPLPKNMNWWFMTRMRQKKAGCCAKWPAWLFEVGIRNGAPAVPPILRCLANSKPVSRRPRSDWIIGEYWWYPCKPDLLGPELSDIFSFFFFVHHWWYFIGHEAANSDLYLRYMVGNSMPVVPCSYSHPPHGMTQRIAPAWPEQIHKRLHLVWRVDQGASINWGFLSHGATPIVFFLGKVMGKWWVMMGKWWDM